MPRYLVWYNDNSDHNGACVRSGDSPEEVAESYAEDIWHECDYPDEMVIFVIETEEGQLTDEQAKTATRCTVYADQSVTFSVFEND